VVPPNGLSKLIFLHLLQLLDIQFWFFFWCFILPYALTLLLIIPPYLLLYKFKAIKKVYV